MNNNSLNMNKKIDIDYDITNGVSAPLNIIL